MPDFRAYAPAIPADAREIRLGADESHHLVAVNRCQRGDPVAAFDGRGREWVCECIDPAKNSAVLRVKETRQAKPLPHAITLAQSLPKGSTMDEIVRQATELGAARIVPLLSERTQVHLEADRQDKKLEKWRTAAIEAAKQCGNPWLPELGPVQKFSDLLAATKAYDLRLVASLHPGAASLKAAIAHYRTTHGRAPHKVLWLVGPEGDFSPAEMTAAVMAGFAPITLGPLVLRCDTAAVAALSVLGHELASGG
ncbi:MAG: 16S rRNA (uracil(1498)-N(3))-methyltransferase [Opitutae bacterium]|nr:16S rRNA (uracil(1498)-N(3))-methyltransferase [Opitutae bacterium]